MQISNALAKVPQFHKPMHSFSTVKLISQWPCILKIFYATPSNTNPTCQEKWFQISQPKSHGTRKEASAPPLPRGTGAKVSLFRNPFRVLPQLSRSHVNFQKSLSSPNSRRSSGSFPFSFSCATTRRHWYMSRSIRSRIDWLYAFAEQPEFLASLPLRRWQGAAVWIFISVRWREGEVTGEGSV